MPRFALAAKLTAPLSTVPMLARENSPPAVPPWTANVAPELVTETLPAVDHPGTAGVAGDRNAAGDRRLASVGIRIGEHEDAAAVAERARCH